MSLRRAVVTSIVIFLAFASAGSAAGIDDGLQWLQDNQHPEGFWHLVPDPDSLDSSIPATTQALLALAEAGRTSPSITRGRVWLGHRHALATGEAAQALEVLASAGENATAAKDTLVGLRRSDMRWGTWKGWEADLEEDALASGALGTVTPRNPADVAGAVAFMLEAQDASGGWGIDHGDDASRPVGVHDTAVVLWGLLPWDTSFVGTSDAIDRGVSWLVTHANTDGGFGDDPDVTSEPSNVTDTALAVAVLCRSGRPAAIPAVTAGVAWLEARQDGSSGSWGGNVLATALAVRALQCSAPNLNVASDDLTFDPANPSPGNPVALNALVKNLGLRTTGGDVVVRFYLGDPRGTGVPLSPPLSLGVIAAGGSAPAAYIWPNAGDAGIKQICVMSDEPETIDEGNELDNVTCKALVVGNTPDISALFDLAWANPPAPWYETTPIRFLAKAHNGGLQNLDDTVLIELWQGTPGDQPPPIAIAGPDDALIGADYDPGLAPPITLAAGSHEICARARIQGLDPSEELDATNNVVCRTVTIGAAPNLNVTRADIVIAPPRPRPTDTLTITYTVRNTSSVPIALVKAELWDGRWDEGGTQLGGTCDLGTLGAGSDGDCNWSGTRPAGCHVFWVRTWSADAAVVETNRADNEANKRQCLLTSNTPPTANAGTTYSAPEGTLIVFDAAASTDPDDNIATIEWDLDDDGQFDDVDTWDSDNDEDLTDTDERRVRAAFAGPGTYTVRVRVTDDWGDSNEASAGVDVSDVAATLGATGALTGNEPATICLDAATVSVTDPGLLNTLVKVRTDWPAPASDGSSRFGLAGLWRMEGGVVDATLQQSSTIQGSPSWTPGEYRQGMTCNPADGVDGVLVASPADFPRKDITVSLWLRRATPGSGGTLVSLAGADGPFKVVATTTGFVAEVPGGAAALVATPDAAWHHLTASWRSCTGKVRLGLDGALGSPQDVATSATRTLGPGAFGIGWDVTGMEAGWNGSIDEVRVYGRELRGSEVGALFAAPPMIVEPASTPHVAASLDCACGTFPDDESAPVVACAVPGGCADVPLTVQNVPPVIDGGRIDFRSGWAGKVYRTGAPFPSWTVSADGKTATETANSESTIFYGPLEAANSRITGRMRIAWNGDPDEDVVGFVLGYDTDPAGPIDEILIDWKKAPDCGHPPMGCGFVGLELSRVTGPNPDTWDHVAGDLVELASGLTRGSTGWAYDTDYDFVFEIGPTRLRVWVNGTLEFDVAGCFGPGRFGLYNLSQANTRYSDFKYTRFGGVEGSPLTVSATFTDPGLLDTHSGSITWGDGTPPEPADVRQDAGGGSLMASHAYAQDGTYFGSLCALDDDGGSDCASLTIDIANEAPIVDAGPDVTVGVGATVSLPPATFTDAGVLDMHEATIDWDDASAIELGDVRESGGRGTVDGSHAYSAGGTYDVTVCVTDDPGCAFDSVERNGSAGTPGVLTRGPWQMHDGLEVTTDNPLGLVDFACVPDRHGADCEYNEATYPPPTDPGWRPAPELNAIGYAIGSRVCSAPHSCVDWADYTYFQTFIGIPDIVVTTFSISFSGIDDGVRVTIFNSAWPGGLVVPGSYVYLGGSGTTNLAPYVMPREVNRVVITHVDDCCSGSSLGRADILLNGGVVGTTCQGPADCGDDDPCTDDVCTPEGVCTNPPTCPNHCALVLTNAANQSGSVFQPHPIVLGADGSFSTHFRFRLTSSGGGADSDGPGGDGLAFVIQADPDGAAAVGTGLGLAGIAPSVAVELDTFDNGSVDGFSGNHVGVDVNGNLASVVRTPVPGRFNDGTTWNAWIDHDGAADRMEVRISASDVRPALPTLTYDVDLASAVGPLGYVGFTAGTGTEFSRQAVLDWQMRAAFSPFESCRIGDAPSTSCDTFRVTVGSNQAPACVAGGPYASSCRTAVASGATVTDLDGDAIDWAWTVVPGAFSGVITIDAPSSGTLAAGTGVRGIPSVTVRLDAGTDPCDVVAALRLTVTDPAGAQSTCDAAITFDDNTAPTLVGVPANAVAQCNAVPPPATVTATDACDTAPTVELVETQSSCAALLSGLAAWWPAEGASGDVIGGRGGTLVGDAGYATGKVGQAFRFDGTGDSVSAPDNPIFTLGTAAFTVDLWVQFASIPSRATFVAHDEAGGSQRKWLLWYDSVGLPGPALRFHVDGPGIGPIDPVVAPWTPATGRWYHVAVTRSASTFKLYIDGVNVATQANTVNIPDPPASLTIGDAEGFGLNGLADEVDLYPGTALSDAQILSLYQAGSAGKCWPDMPTCPQDFTITRTWTARDACGNTTKATQVIRVYDTTRPTIACPAPVTVQCATAVPAPTPGTISASDNCDPAPVVTFRGDVIVGMTCPNRYTVQRTYRATDACWNWTDCVQTITVNDTTPPTLACPAPVTVQCPSLVPAPAPASVVASDNCGGAPTVAHVSDQTVNVICTNKYTVLRTYRATDACGNSATCVQTITVSDTTPPTIACPAPVTVQCATMVPVPAPASVVATDNCTPAPTVAHVGDQTVNVICTNKYTVLRTYRATDTCGNSATCVQTITVDDTTAPTLTCPAPLTVQCASLVPAPAPASVVAADNCAPAPTVTHAGDQTVNVICANKYTVLRTYRATDACGNSATCVQTITVNDTTPPTLTCPAPVTVQCASQVPAPSPGTVPATDNCTPAPTVTHVGDVIVNQTCLDRFTVQRTYRATDACGNSATCMQLITVNDTTPPVVTVDTARKYCLWPPNHQYVCFDRTSFTPVIADACGHAVTWTFAGCASSQPDDATGVGDGNTTNDCTVAADGLSFCVRAERQGVDENGRDYTVTIRATDACGNQSAPTAIGKIHVPHDHRDRRVSSCISAH